MTIQLWDSSDRSAIFEQYQHQDNQQQRCKERQSHCRKNQIEGPLPAHRFIGA
ncbi:MAG: hypothetical protein KME58_10785 [Candidatus Thiodiazotropha sp. (ex Lucina pensylvanica)]|nr:hypothetical protein [Candidatus Thiodiazotropha sp. (ex Lucina pensylvanica)]MCU7896131.1 hypothetical protein [Candidatus Thiodiazotropha sp. (ex Lucinoma aequizonata)]